MYKNMKIPWKIRKKTTKLLFRKKRFKEMPSLTKFKGPFIQIGWLVVILTFVNFSTLDRDMMHLH